VDLGWPKLRYGLLTYRSSVCAFRYVPGGQCYADHWLSFFAMGANIDPAPHAVLGFGYGRTIGDSCGTTSTMTAVKVPLWAMIASALWGAGWAVINFRRTGRAARVGLCMRCGYDLRASPHRCPECGEIPRRPHTMTTRYEAECASSVTWRRPFLLHLGSWLWRGSGGAFNRLSEVTSVARFASGRRPRSLHRAPRWLGQVGPRASCMSMFGRSCLALRPLQCLRSPDRPRHQTTVRRQAAGVFLLRQDSSSGVGRSGRPRAAPAGIATACAGAGFSRAAPGGLLCSRLRPPRRKEKSARHSALASLDRNRLRRPSPAAAGAASGQCSCGIHVGPSLRFQ
jgi:hypothetical protein